MKEKFKQIKNSIGAKMCVVAAGVGSVMVPMASAAEGDTAVTSAFTTGFQGIASNAMEMIALIIPIALGVAGTIFVARKAIGWFKSLAK